MTTTPRSAFRSVLFIPAHRVELLEKVPRWGPDVVVVDLEDAVAPGDKDAARARVIDADLRRDDVTALIRVNPPGSPWFDDDVDAVRRSGAAGAVVPKAEDPDVLAHVLSRLAEGRDTPILIAGIETAAGVSNARQILAGAPAAAYFGAEDYIADLGGRRTPEGMEVLYARSAVALAGRLAQVPVVDQAVVRLDDVAFTTDARQGRDLGYVGKICIHPRQVALAHEVFTPTVAEVQAATRVLEVAEAGVGVVDGQMVDAVHVRLARQVLDRAAASGTPTIEEPPR